jgi:DNA polymerase-3 subunit chi
MDTTLVAAQRTMATCGESMTILHFYQVQQPTPAAVDAVVPPLASKAAAAGQPLLLVAPTLTRARRLDELLWTFTAESFLPHAQAGCAHPHWQAVLLTHAEEQSFLMPEGRLPLVLAGAESALEPIKKAGAEKIFYLFSAAPHDVERARALYKQHQAAGDTLKYFQQAETGWEAK